MSPRYKASQFELLPWAPYFRLGNLVSGRLNTNSRHLKKKKKCGQSKIMFPRYPQQIGTHRINFPRILIFPKTSRRKAGAVFCNCHTFENPLFKLSRFSYSKLSTRKKRCIYQAKNPNGLKRKNLVRKATKLSVPHEHRTLTSGR